MFENKERRLEKSFEELEKAFYSFANIASKYEGEFAERLIDSITEMESELFRIHSLVPEIERYKKLEEKTSQRKIEESSLSRIYKHYMEHDTGTISAFRYGYSTKENKQRNSDLKGYLLSRGYGVTSIKGKCIENYNSDDAVEVSEESFFVVDLKDTGKLKEDLKKMGRKFEQDSITFSESGESGGEYYLIGLKPDVYPGNREIKLSKPLMGKDGEFYSSVNGRPFIFENYRDLSSYHHCNDMLKKYNTGSIRFIKGIYSWEDN